MAAGALLAIALTSLPLFGDENMHVADDIWYHLLRIDNIRAGLLSGQFPVRMGEALVVGDWRTMPFPETRAHRLSLAPRM